MVNVENVTNYWCHELWRPFFMPAPPIQLFLTTIVAQPTLKSRQEYILRILQARKIPYTSYDLASDEAAKAVWKRRAPIGKQELPGILVGGKYPGSFTEFEEAVEFGELDVFLRRNENWVEESANPAVHLPAVPIGLPAVYLPSELMDKKFSVPNASQTQTEVKPKVDKGIISTRDGLSSHGSQGIKVSEQELLDLIKELDLSIGDANALTKSLSPDIAFSSNSEPQVKDGLTVDKAK